MSFAEQLKKERERLGLTRAEASAVLRDPILAKYKSAGLPMREITMWQVMEFAVNKLHSEMLP